MIICRTEGGDRQRILTRADNGVIKWNPHKGAYASLTMRINADTTIAAYEECGPDLVVEDINGQSGRHCSKYRIYAVHKFVTARANVGFAPNE